MSKAKFQKSALWAVERKDLQSLFDALVRKQCQILGPVLDRAALIYDEASPVKELPIGILDHQDGGSYRLEKANSAALFSYIFGPHSWKKYLHPPEKKLFDVKRHRHGFEVVADNGKPPKPAFVGVRPCELSALAILDKILIEGLSHDAHYVDNLWCQGHKFPARHRSNTGDKNCR